ncbi:Eco57I restriction-modification methylase domain-containing protein [Oligosphaera ethanolica]|uniref:site-specific DNA-methyltransferase (adenine-specific) n=1 Tax=Oligosphaera ethanolica TaxID=760260 RepID=A0AAE3VH74_9BACT|nr:N-6 DNA methylase [Oligosphaera ethanolica]MDQ0290433.1 type I restriction-modification system DNA methylase subunit [Oligosphaera ethanolica]
MSNDLDISIYTSFQAKPSQKDRAFAGLNDFLSEKCRDFLPYNDQLQAFNKDNKYGFAYLNKIGCMPLDSDKAFYVYYVRINGDLNERSCRRNQYEFAKEIIGLSKIFQWNAWMVNKGKEWTISKYALFIFADEHNRFRFSLVEVLNPNEEAPKRYRRYTFFVDPAQTNRTFKERMAKPWTSFEDLKDAFSVERLSKEFFDKYKEIYLKFVAAANDEPTTPGHFKTAFPENSDKAIRDYVKKMMGRLVFLQFLQKKGWLGVKEGDAWGTGDKQYLLHLFHSKPENNRGNFLEEVLEKLFFETLNIDRSASGDLADDVLSSDYDYAIRIPYLNGGLFDKDEADKLTIKFVSAARLYQELFDTFERFNFTVDENASDDADIGVDPEMLGHIFENLLEDNKDKGAFYTPKEIVEYMCQESLIAYLGDTPAIRQLVQNQDAAEIAAVDKPALLEKLRSVKICDPAIGSGAFPMGLLNLLLNVRSALEDMEDTSAARVKAKQDIILNNIYGVDIEAGAIDIARLRFWLSIVVDAQAPIPLPYFDYKFMQGNSLLESFMGVDLSRIDPISGNYRPMEYSNVANPTMVAEGSATKQQILDIYDEGTTVCSIVFDIRQYYSEAHADKREKLREDIHQKVLTFINKSVDNKFDITASKREEIKRIAAEVKLGNAPFTLWHLYFADVFAKGGFDIVIGNPPYVSTKGRDLNDNANLEDAYGFADDLYSHFVFLGYNLLNDNGIQTMITSDTYFTTLTKKRLREKILKNTLLQLVHWGHDIFETAMVSTATFISQKKPPAKNDTLKIIDVKGRKALSDASVFTLKQDIFNSSINGAFFVPHKLNCTINDKFLKKHAALLAEWWDKIVTSQKTVSNSNDLVSYRKNLKTGNCTLLGMVSDGGVGLQTGDNGRFVGVLSTSKIAKRIRLSRVKKLQEFNKKYHASFSLSDSEEEIWRLFDGIKNNYGRRAFGKGYLYRIVPDHLIADVHSLTEKEKENGITSERSFVPYDKGDKDGNRWYLETPYVIDWSEKTVSFLKTNSGKKGAGMPVVRNPQFFFKEGFCYSDIKTFFIQCRAKGISVHDVASMSFFPVCEKFPYYYLITLINSHMTATLIYSFLNNTPHFQINDCRMLPIIVPSEEQLGKCKELFNSAIAIQKDYFAKRLDRTMRDDKLRAVQDKVDAFVYGLYGIETTDFLNHTNKVYSIKSDSLAANQNISDNIEDEDEDEDQVDAADDFRN